MKKHTVILMLSTDGNGLEGFVDISDADIEHEVDTWEKLKDPSYQRDDWDFNLNHVELRCRFNTQRDLECWGITLDGDIDLEAFKANFNQETRALVREKGIKFV